MQVWIRHNEEYIHLDGETGKYHLVTLEIQGCPKAYVFNGDLNLYRDGCEDSKLNYLKMENINSTEQLIDIRKFRGVQQTSDIIKIIVPIGEDDNLCRLQVLLSEIEDVIKNNYKEYKQKQCIIDALMEKVNQSKEYSITID